MHTHIDNITTKEILMTIIALISVVGHMFETDIYNYLLSLPTLYSSCPQQVP